MGLCLVKMSDSLIPSILGLRMLTPRLIFGQFIFSSLELDPNEHMRHVTSNYLWKTYFRTITIVFLERIQDTHNTSHVLIKWTCSIFVIRWILSLQYVKLVYYQWAVTSLKLLLLVWRHGGIDWYFQWCARIPWEIPRDSRVFQCWNERFLRWFLRCSKFWNWK